MAQGSGAHGHRLEDSGHKRGNVDPEIGARHADQTKVVLGDPVIPEVGPRLPRELIHGLLDQPTASGDRKLAGLICLAPQRFPCLLR